MKENATVLNSEGECISRESEMTEIVENEAGALLIVAATSPVVAPWSDNTLEQHRIQKRLIELNVKIIASHTLANMSDNTLTVACCYSGRDTEIDCVQLVSVTSRYSNDALWRELNEKQSQWKDAGIELIKRIGDCASPGLIANAVYSGHGFARDFGLTESPQPLREDMAINSKEDTKWRQAQPNDKPGKQCTD